MTLETFRSLSEQYTAIPVYRTLFSDTLTPVSLFLKIRQGSDYPFLLESVEGGEKLARYSFIGCNPYQLLKLQHNSLYTVKEGITTKAAASDFFKTLDSLTREYSEPKLNGLPRLTGGAVGFASYDIVRLIENLNNTPPDELDLPDSIWGFYDEIYAFDHVKHQILLIKTVRLDTASADLNHFYQKAQRSLDRMEEITKKDVAAAFPFRLGSQPLISNTSKEHYCTMVEKAKKHIFEGDIFQVVLSQRFEKEFTGDRFMLYRALRMVNPSPYLFYLDFHDFALIGSSPEVLVRVTDGKAEVLPIAGTRKRGSTREEDEYLENELLADSKETSEHIMLVDLGRNDLSRVCEPGSVTLVRNMVIERYSHVMHIVSDVAGKLDIGKTSVDALLNCFPAGTVSGAPKVRAMQLIDEMEVSKRGPYAGAVGYFDFSGNMDTCIAIRTMVATNNKVFIQAGAGIVADSNPENEFDETVNKARALVESLGVALKIGK